MAGNTDGIMSDKTGSNEIQVVFWTLPLTSCVNLTVIYSRSCLISNKIGIVILTFLKGMLGGEINVD